jgi:putative heme-binding domain-containing protein
MRRAAFLAVCLCLLVGVETSAGQPPLVATTDPRLPEEQLKAFHLPSGFIAQLVAAEPKINKPINIAFDAAGRLWVTESVEYPFPAPPGRKPKDRVKILEDFGPDGLARKVTTFADGLNIPIGVLPTSRGAIVYSIPNVYHLTDTHGAGKANRRDILLSSYGFNDTHGMTGEFTPGFDGWIYACHGFSNTSNVKGKGPQSITMQSGNTYRFKSDGSHLEYFTHGQVNPFGLAFDPSGNLYSCDCHTRPIYQLLRGAYYPSFGAPHDGLGFGPEMMRHDHGSTAIAGIAYYAATQFPKEFRDNLFVGNVVTNRINRDRLQWHGSTPNAIEMPDLVKSDDPWFRPVDIKLGPDGALYVADFYNRIIGHYEVPLNHPGRDRFRGRIWRIVYRGEKGCSVPPVPNLGRFATTELVKSLADPNLTIRLQAANLLVDRGEGGHDDVLRALASANPLQRAHALWALYRQRALSPEALEKATKDPETLVRVHAMRVLADRPNWTDAMDGLALTGLRDEDPLVRRAAAGAVGAHPQAAHVAPLLQLLHSVDRADTHLLHTVRMGLRDQLVPASVWAQLTESAFSEKDARAIADICPGLRSPQSANFLIRHLQRWQEGSENLTRYAHHVARYGTSEATKDLLHLARSKLAGDLGTEAALFKAAYQGTQERGDALGTAQRRWVEDLVGRLLASSDAALTAAGTEWAGTLKIGAAEDALLRLATDRKLAAARRKNVLAALLSIQPEKHVVFASRILVNPVEPEELREQAANSLAGTNLPAAQAELIKALQETPAPLQKVIALGMSGSKQGAEKLLDAVALGKASARLLQDRPVELRLEQARVPNLRERLTRLTRGLPPSDARLQELLNRRRSGFLQAKTDATVGFKVFEKNCASCHQIKNQGAKIGPQLDGVGNRGLDRLLEDILDPNRNVDQAFRATTLTLKDGKIVTGLFLRKDGAVLVMADAQGKEVRVPGDTVDERLVSQLSPMPANFADQIAEADFHHLMAFLLEQRAK